MWGTNILVFKASIRDLDPWVFNGLRLIFAFVTLGILVWADARLRPVKEPQPPIPWGRVVLFSALNGFLYLVMFVKGIELTTAGNTALILASMPMWTAVLSLIFLRERLPRVTWLGLLVTFCGTVVVTTQGSGEVSLASRYFIGNLVMLCAALTWATGTVVSRSILQTMRPLRLTFISCALTTPFHLMLAIPSISEEIPKLLQPTTFAALAYSGIFSTGIAYATWNAGVRAVGGSHAAVYQNVVTLVAVVGGWFILKEQPYAAQIVGGLFIVLGLFLMRRGRRSI